MSTQEYPEGGKRNQIAPSVFDVCARVVADSPYGWKLLAKQTAQHISDPGT